MCWVEGSKNWSQNGGTIFFLVYLDEARMRANTQHISRGAGDKRGSNGKAKTVGNSDIRRSMEGRGMGWGTWDIQDGHTGTFRKENRKFEGGGFGVE